MRLYQLNRQEKHMAKLVMKTKIMDLMLRLATFAALVATGSAFTQPDNLTKAVIVSAIALSCFVVGIRLCMKSKRLLEHRQDILEHIRRQKAERLSI